jgi:hypothetical protein
MTAEVRAVKPDKSFVFEIVFDRLTQTELDTLLWVLTFGDHASTHAHKLGRGKPVGYGSVCYVVTKTMIYELKNDLTLGLPEKHKDGYSVDYTNVKAAKKVAVDYMTMTNFESAPKNINYPMGTNNKGKTGIYQWFSENKGKMSDPEFKQVLKKPHEIMPLGKPVETRPLLKIAGLNTDSLAEPTPMLYPEYKSAQIKEWLKPFDKSNKTIKGLTSYVADFERALTEGDKRYNSIAHFYEPAKKKLQSLS